MKVTFIEPPKENKKSTVERVFGCTYTLYPFPNIFNLYVAATLRKNGIEVLYQDAAAENISKKRFLEYISKDNSDIYYIHSVNLSIDSDINLSKDILSLRSNAKIIFAGPAPTYFTKDYLHDERIYAIRGETELAAFELIKWLEGRNDDIEKIKGLSFIKEGDIINNPSHPLLEDLDILPFPARDIIKRDLYYNPKLPKGYFTPMLASRNCPYNCIFCVPNSQSFSTELEYKKSFGKKPPVRLRSAENIIDEMHKIKEDGYQFVSFIDDQFLWSEERTLGICNGIKDLGITWGCLARCDRISETVCKAMHEAGCAYIDLGIESFSQETLDYTEKGLTLNDIYNAVSIIKKYRIKTKINMLLGVNPLETEKDLWRNIDECIRLRPEAIMFSIACPFPGTEFYEIAKRNNWLENNKYRPVSVQHGAILNLPALSHKKLKSIIKKANIKFYANPAFIIKNLFRVAHPKNLICTVNAFCRKMSA